MGILYKEPNEVTVSVEIRQVNGRIEFEFTSDSGKFGSIENLAGYSFQPERLLDIFSGIDVSDDEII